MILEKKKARISEGDVRKKGKLKEYPPEKILAVRAEKTITGFTSEDINEVRRTVESMTAELNQRILDLFQQKSAEKLARLQERMEVNGQSYKERNDVFSGELGEMNSRFDHLKRNEQRWHDIIEHGQDYKEQKMRRRLCFNILKDYWHHKKQDNKTMQKHTVAYKKNMLKRCFLHMREQGLENRAKRKVDLVFQKVIKEIKIGSDSPDSRDIEEHQRPQRANFAERT